MSFTLRAFFMSFFIDFTAYFGIVVPDIGLVSFIEANLVKAVIL